MTRWRTTALDDLLIQRPEEYRIADDSVETFVTVRLYGKGAVRREIAAGKTPVMRNGYRLIAGDLVYSRIDARNGAFAIVPQELSGAVVSKDFPCFAIRKDRVHPSFLIRFLGSAEFYRQLRASSFGTTNRQRIGEQAFLRYRIPLPPVPEQERIVRILDEAEALCHRRVQADDRFGGLIPAVFNALIGPAEAQRNGFPSKPLGGVCSFVSGGTPSTENPDFWTGPIPWVSPKDMKTADVLDATDHISEAALLASRLRLLPENTLLMVVRGMILAHTFPVAITRVPVTINQDMKGLVLNDEVIPEYLLWCLKELSPKILSLVSTAGHGTKRIETESLIGLQVPVPPLQLQRAFAARVTEIRELETAQAISRRRLDDLLQSVLHHAFQGEL